MIIVVIVEYTNEYCAMQFLTTHRLRRSLFPASDPGRENPKKPQSQKRDKQLPSSPLSIY